VRTPLTGLTPVRDEEAAGSNPVTPTHVLAGQRPCPIRDGAFALTRTATKYRNGAQGFAGRLRADLGADLHGHRQMIADTSAQAPRSDVPTASEQRVNGPIEIGHFARRE